MTKFILKSFLAYKTRLSLIFGEWELGEGKGFRRKYQTKFVMADKNPFSFGI